MQRKLAAYMFLSFVSFCFFSLLFRSVAKADTLTNIPASPPQLLNGQVIPSEVVSPSPTIPLIAVNAQAEVLGTQPADTAISPAAPQDSPTATPTPYTESVRPSTVPSPTLLAAAQETVSPTQTPSPTPTPAALPTSSFTIGGQAESAVAPTATPTPTIAPTQTPVAAVDLESLFQKYSSQYSVDKNELEKIARCESGFNSNSNNAGLYLGMFQFAASSWSAERTLMGLDPNPDLRTNAEESIKTAAFMLSRGQQNAWPSCK